MLGSRDASTTKGFGLLPLALAAALAIFALVNAAGAAAAVTASTDAGAVAGAITDAQPGLQTGASFTVNGPLAECANGADDDANGRVDTQDLGCTNASDNSEEPGVGFFGTPECQNQEDDDGDGLIDHPADGQCGSATDADESAPGIQQPECSTASEDDFDTDGGTFAAGDPECSAAGDNDESFVEECADGADNDSDGLNNLADPGCSFAYDDDESSNNGVGGGASKQAGISDVPLTGFPRSGGTFGVLTSGDAELADDPNSEGGSGPNTGGQAYQDAFDPVTLKIDINVPTGANCVGFDFRFLSEEFPEFVNAGFNDAFVAQLDQLSVSVSGQSINAPGDFAAGAGDSISVDSAGPSGMADFFAAGTTYDGATPRLVARKPVSPGAHSIFLTIFDAGDHILDSAVFVDNLKTSTEEPGKCKSLALEPFEGTTGVSFGNPANPFGLSPDLAALVFLATCNLPSGGEIGCNPSFNLNFAPGGGNARAQERRAAATPLAAGTASIASGQTQQVSLATTAAGKKAVKAAIDRPKKLLKKAKKLVKKAREADGAQKAKLLKKAKKLKKQAKKLKKAPLGTVSGTITNPTNGATEAVSFSLPR